MAPTARAARASEPPTLELVLKRNSVERLKREKSPLGMLGELPSLIAAGYADIPEEDIVRLKWWGLYHDKPKVGTFMLRIKLPAGRIEPHQLRVVGEQRYHVASVAKSFWQAAGRDGYWMRAIYAGAEPVGFVMLRERDDEVYLNRLLVDFRHQGRGYGCEAVRLVIARARARTGCKRVRLSYVPSNPAAARLYASFGFRPTGLVDEDGEAEMVLELA